MFSTKFILKVSIAFIFLTFGFSCKRSQNSQGFTGDPVNPISVWHKGAPPFEMPEITLPEFPDKEFNITDYGAVSDTGVINTKAIADAIEACHKAGGGTVKIPPGRWFTGAIHLKSNVNLNIEKGAEVLFSSNPEDYLPVVFTRWEGIECYNYSPLVYAKDCQNIAITGKGSFNGQGKPWHPWKKLQKAQELYDTEFNKIPVEERIYGSPEAALRPQMIQLLNCEKVLLEDYTSGNSPFWNNHLVYCSSVTVRNIRLVNDPNAPNSDGINFDSCNGVHVSGVHAKVGDDAICIKSGMNEDGWRVGKPCQNILIEDCYVEHGHGGIVFGSDTSGGVENIYIRNCTYDGTDIGIRMKSMRGRGGYVKNIYAENINMKDIKDQAIKINMFYGASSAKNRSEIPPTFKNIHIRNITCKGAKEAINIKGLPEKAAERIFIENVNINAKYGFYADNMANSLLRNVTIIPEEGEAFRLGNCQGVTFENCSSILPKQEIIK